MRGGRREAALVAVTIAGVLACGSRTALFVGVGDGGPQVDATVADAGGADADAGRVDPCADAGAPDASAGDGGCVGLACRVAACGGGAHTTLRGRVLDPAGNLPVYDVLVYVPNGPLEPISPGNPVCSRCQAVASGSPLVSALTDANGAFTLIDPPAGADVPLVVQLGKWRRVVTVPTIAACAGNVLDPGATRLPAKSDEGDMPLIALTTGCDPAECFLRHLGIDDSEFVPPDSPTGHVHVYVGQQGDHVGWSNVPGGDTVAQTYGWWQDAAHLLRYDIVFNACECNWYDRDTMYASGAAYQAMEAYLYGGGRLFATHFFGNWFEDPGTVALRSTARWSQYIFQTTYIGDPETDVVDQTFPKGQAYAQWLVNAGVSASLGAVALYDTRDDVWGQAPPGCHTADGTCLDTAWLNEQSSMHPRYLSVNTPVGAPAAMQCGRGVFSDVHISGTSDGSQFPAECANADPMGHYRDNERALEFLFFDLSSCVQDDSQPPAPPCQR